MGRLPTGVEPEYTAQIVIMAKPSFAGELRAYAEASSRFASDLQREVMERGWALVKPELDEAKKKPTRARVAYWIARVTRPSSAERARKTAERRQRIAKASAGSTAGA